MECRETDIQRVLANLFRAAGARCTIDSNVHGNVSLNLPTQTFAQDFRDILLSADLTYMVDSGVYEVIRSPQFGGPLPGQARFKNGPADSTRTSVPLQHLGPVTVVDSNVRNLIVRLFAKGAGHYVVGPAVQGNITVDLPRMTFGEIISFVSASCDSRREVLDGAWIFSGPYRIINTGPQSGGPPKS
jgi:type II secretory pathway component GspD/PulD (secretin)